ncbi:hypothetical protein [Nostoc sp. FACHB-110]|nr:hypothetical protein [Nostoc sp. FACHB-110]MBD2437662.1 hypothetical protein [Nostoc sp. FACHB-110]
MKLIVDCGILFWDSVAHSILMLTQVMSGQFTSVQQDVILTRVLADY